jgi:hypothetical protein
MTDLPKHTDPTSRKCSGEGGVALPSRLVVVDIDVAIAALLVDRFTPAGAAIGYDARASKYNIPTSDPDALETVKRFDHGWFAAHPGATKYIRELLPDEFEVELEPLPPRWRWAVEVTAFRDRISDQVMLRIRASVVVPVNDTPAGGEK